MPTFYEFFAGGGMARSGLGESWDCIFANDFSDQKAKSYRANWGSEHLIVEDINKIHSSDLPGHADLAWASFPCQDLSLAGNGAGLQGSRSGTFWGFLKIIQELQSEGRKPSMIVLENVYGTLTSHEGRDFEAIAKSLADEGYNFGAVVMDAVHFVPQSRPRVFIICVDERLAIPTEAICERASSAWHPEKVICAFNALPNRIKNKWVWWNIPEPNQHLMTLAEIVEVEPQGVKWHSDEETQRLLSMMAPLHRKKVLSAQQNGSLQVGTIYKRTRNGIQRAEVRFDGVAGCLRTPGGGSSRQTIMVVEGSIIRTRLISPREAARLMGLPENYVLPQKYNEAYHLVGDGVVVPVVSHINQNILLPIVNENLQFQVQEYIA
ncbi:DNA cytosine methyltransferase [Photobacterium sp. WH77]|uniref:DNA cytosine methyltransferase n=1 Tax=unclassified Photobacterium TaxID=2628852 RepID=UPI001EDBBE8D|nr:MULTISPECIES: DNA cytosine methyltransferase [unclassified Photobacterium]MCG2837305.1 DNA cytosine methyltransferase [Photobacterium sp. WH77]MCG2844921.1 DNA cytosine methyltransferase [Photobacterium sp. WH80]